MSKRDKDRKNGGRISSSLVDDLLGRDKSAFGQPMRQLTDGMRPQRLQKAQPMQKKGNSDMGFLFPTRQDWTDYAALATIAFDVTPLEALYTTAALARSQQLDGAITQKLTDGINAAQEAKGAMGVVDIKVWREIGLIDLMNFFKSVEDDIRTIRSRQALIANYEAKKDKSPGAKRQYAEEKGAEITAIKAQILDKMFAHMQLADSVATGGSEKDICKELEKVYTDVVEPWTAALFLDEKGPLLRQAIERHIHGKPLPADAALLAPFKGVSLEELEELCRERGMAVSGPIADAIIGLRGVIKDYQAYHVIMKAAEKDTSHVAHALIEKAAAKHEDAYALMKEVMPRLTEVCDTVIAMAPEPKLMHTKFGPGELSNAADILHDLQEGYPQAPSIEYLARKYNNARAVTEIQDLHSDLVENAGLLARSEQAIRVVTSAEAEGRTPTNEEMKEAYKGLRLVLSIMAFSVNLLKQKAEGVGEMPVSAEMDGRIKKLAADMRQYIEPKNQKLLEVLGGFLRSMDSVELARLHAENLKELSQTVFASMEKRHAGLDGIGAIITSR